ncbi:MAG: GIY-YIG nuclease family protein [Candidatus Heimdallarchaeota archaeon]|nr:MAG: GIY-YIG nuclease family protein [Candidatus Heimdallarchaeota archaeon]
MPYWVYMLFVGDQRHGVNRKIYTGYTQHLMPRIIQHSGLTSTKGAHLTRKQPIELVFLEFYKSRRKAIHRERQLKYESPYNQKKHKLNLIRDFSSEYGPLLAKVNSKLTEHFEFLNSFIKTMEEVQNEFITKLQ